jgi:hypothetical protein
MDLWGFVGLLLGVPMALVLLVMWRQARRRPWTRREATGLRKLRWGFGSASRRMGLPEGGPRGGRREGQGQGQGPYDRATHLD